MSELESLRAELAALRSEVAALRGAPDEPVSRRGLFTKVAGVAAAGAGLSLLGGRSAEAITGTMQFGTSNNAGTSGTSLSSTSSQRTFDITQGGTADGLGVDITATGSTASAIWARHNGDGNAVDAAILNPNSSKAAVYGYAGGGTGVEGHGVVGLHGIDENGGGTGVLGESSSGIGLYGHSSGGRAVYGYTDSGTGIYGWGGSAGIALLGYAGRAQMLLQPGSFAGHPTSGTHDKGEVYCDSDGAHWVCIATGTPGTWVRPGFNAMDPARLLNGDVAAGQFAAKQSKDVTVVGFHGIPAGATAVALTLSARSNADGYATLWPTGSTRPGIAQVNFASEHQWTSFAIVKLGTGGKISVYNSAGTTRVFLDVAGFFA
jgi:hypothetical protein